MLKHFLRTIPKTVNLLAIGALIATILKIFIFNKIREPLRGFHEVGLIFEGLLASVFASYVFYLIVIHVKEVRDRTAVSPYIYRWAGRLVSSCKDQIQVLSKISGVTLSFKTLDRGSLGMAIAKLEPLLSGDDAAIYNRSNWYSFMDGERRTSSFCT